MKAYFISNFFFLLFLLFFSSCNEDLSESLEGYSVELRLSSEEVLPAFDNGLITFTNLSSGKRMVFSYPLSTDVMILPGIYDVSFEAKSGDRDYFAVKRSVEIMSNGSLIIFHVFSNHHTDDLIIAEIFFSGTLQTSGNQYYGDDYIKLYNNSDKIVYADGLTIFETKFLTTEKRAYFPDRMSEGVTAHALYTIPGNGRDCPVAPGEYLLIADSGIDHREINPNSFDLRGADWEWYDVSSVPSSLDIDSPLVPNLDKWYCYTKSLFLLHNRGFRGIGIARLPEGMDRFLSENYYHYEYETVTAVGTFPMTGDGYLVPKYSIADMVNCSVVNGWQWNVSSPELDRGWTHCGFNEDDKSRYFHSVRRKLLYLTEDGRAVFKDTNNSSEDFNPMVTPSEIELQGTVTGPDGARASVTTYDGITPVKK